MTCTVFIQGHIGSVRRQTEPAPPAVHLHQVNPILQSSHNVQEESQLSPVNAEIVTCMGINFKRVNLPSTPSAGQIQFCAHNWMQITGDQWVLEVVKGYKLELDCKPVQHKPPPPLIMSKKDITLTQTEIEKLVIKGAIVPVAPCDRQFLSQLFLVPKKDGSSRPVVNLKALNKFITRKKFKIEGAHLLRDLLRPGDWMASIDLKDAYFSVTWLNKIGNCSGSVSRDRCTSFNACPLASAVPLECLQSC